MNILALVLSFMILSPCAFAAGPVAQPITQGELDQILDQVNVASNAKDLKAIQNLLWDDARFLLISGGQTLNFTVPEYVDVLKDTWGRTKTYTYNYKKENCTFDGPKVSCIGIVQETMTLSDGKFMTSSVRGEDVYEKRDGVIKIIFSKANADEGQVATRQSSHAVLEMK